MIFDDLYKVIKDREINGKDKSYTKYLLDTGTDKILKKVGEECTEVIIAAKENNKDEILICDVGSRTINFLTIINGKTEYNYTERLGVLDLYANIKDIENSKGEDYIEEDIERLIKNGRIVVDSRVYLDFLKLILNRIQAKVNIKNYKVYFTGGGSLLLKEYIEANTPAKVLENAQFSNVLGAHKIAEIGWRGANQ